MVGDPLKLLGTEEAQDTPRLLTAGPLQALLERGALRAIRWRSVEVLRGLAFPVCGEGWGGRAGWRLLDQESFERACLEWRSFREERRPVDLSRGLTLPPYAVAIARDVP